MKEGKAMYSKLLCGLISFLTTVSAVNAMERPDLVQRVEEGSLKEAKAHWWGFDPDDATANLQAAINSGVSRLVVEDMGKPWIISCGTIEGRNGLNLVSNQEIVFRPGVEIKAKKGDFAGAHSSLISLRMVENVTLMGYGAVARMHRKDYAGTQYHQGEWRHLIRIAGSSNINIYGLTLKDSGGDGIYLGTAGGRTNTNIHIRDIVSCCNYRQGMSVINVNGLLVENSVFKNTGKDDIVTRPGSGIDFEPNRADEQLTDIVVRNCKIYDNGGKIFREETEEWRFIGRGLQFSITSLNESSKDVDIRIENGEVWGNKQQWPGEVDVRVNRDNPVGGSVIFSRMEFKNDPGIFIGRRGAEESPAFKVKVEHSNFSGEITALMNRFRGEVDARHNWWGACSGPRGGVIDRESGEKAGGEGAQLTTDCSEIDKIIFDPWLKKPVSDTGTYTAVTAEIAGKGGIRIGDYNLNSEGEAFAGRFSKGEKIELSAEAYKNYIFKGWRIDGVLHESPEIEMPIPDKLFLTIKGIFIEDLSKGERGDTICGGSTGMRLR